MLLTFFLLALAAIWLLSGDAGGADSGTKIAIVSIEGIISSELAEKTVRQLEKYGEDPTIKAMVLRIDSPGGGVASSQEIYAAVKRLRDDGKLVVASLGSLAASGGYYVACAAERIFANPGTITGSIGVIVQLANVEELLQKVGISSTAITSGPFKDSGNPTRPLRPEDRQVFQTLVDDIYQQFVETVAQDRHLPAPQVLQIADGRIYTGRQAKELNLVDELGALQEAVAYVTSALGIIGKAKVVEQERESLWWLKFVLEQLPGASTLQSFSAMDAVVQYRWMH
ncbi:MAG TPA: signal peptide peptidase SppA [Alphaproteobacteria bacterium]|nr:signal peptide peptidase SppA [Alphaproteobacteria bacterium]